MKNFRLWIAVNACLVVALPLAARAQDFTLDHSSLDFGPVTVGDSASLSLTLTSTMVETLIVTNIYFKDSAADAGGAFSIVNHSFPVPWDSFPVVFDVGDSIVTQVSFIPPSVGSYSGYFTIESNHHLYSEFDVPVSGEGVPLVPVPPALCLVIYGLASVGAGKRILRRS